MQNELKIRRALLSVSDKTDLPELARALVKCGTEIVATGNTAQILKEGGIKTTPIQKLTGNPEAFGGRMKTLSYQILSGILYRRGVEEDEKDRESLGIVPIDCVVVNFYPFQSALQKMSLDGEKNKKRSLTHEQLKTLVEEVDIGGPTLVRAGAKNSPHVLVLTHPDQYKKIIDELEAKGTLCTETIESCARAAWECVSEYDQTISRIFGKKRVMDLKYGENPHQSAAIEYYRNSPIAWGEPLTQADLSYNNILDLSSAYSLACDLLEMDPHSSHVVIVKHNNPIGVASVPKTDSLAQKKALMWAWEGDPVSAFGGVVLFSDELEEQTAAWLSDKFVELVASPGLTKDHPALLQMLTKRKNLKALRVRRMKDDSPEFSISVPGGRLLQKSDRTLNEPLKSVTHLKWPVEKEKLARFGIAVCRALKSNAIALVREVPGESDCFQLVGAGQGQPNRVDALQRLAIPRALDVLKTMGGSLKDCVLVSDAFFPFRDSVDQAHAAGIKYIVQPGGSIKDAESVVACDEHAMSMVFTGVRHFRH